LGSLLRLRRLLGLFGALLRLSRLLGLLSPLLRLSRLLGLLRTLLRLRGLLGLLRTLLRLRGLLGGCFGRLRLLFTLLRHRIDGNHRSEKQAHDGLGSQFQEFHGGTLLSVIKGARGHPKKFP
jgi:hypothetical protein